MHLEKIKPHRAYEDVLTQIKNLVVEGKLNPGDRLMSEREMAAALSVSRTTLREALRTLELLGLVEVRPGGGTFIKNHNVNQFIAPLALALSVEQNSITELWETRITLEVECAGLAALRADKENLQFIQDTLTEMKAQLGDVNQFVKLDMRFHNLIALASHNTVLARLHQTFAHHIFGLTKQAGPVRFLHDAGGIQTHQEHVTLYESIAARDAKTARAAMRSHLEGVMREHLAMLQQA